MLLNKFQELLALNELCHKTDCLIEDEVNDIGQVLNRAAMRIARRMITPDEIRPKPEPKPEPEPKLEFKPEPEQPAIMDILRRASVPNHDGLRKTSAVRYLALLKKHPEGLSIPEIAEKIGVSTQATYAAMNKLFAAGWAQRSSISGNRNYVYYADNSAPGEMV